MISRARHVLTIGLCALAFCLTGRSAAAAPIELITNGGFETGTLAGWTTASQGGSCGPFSAASGTSAGSGYLSPGADSGTFYALSSINCGVSADALIQTIVVPVDAIQVTLSFDMFVNNWSYLEAGTDLSVSNPNEHAQVDLLAGTASAFSNGTNLLLTGASNDGVDCGPSDPSCSPVNGYVSYLFDITSLVTPGGTYQIRFGDVASTWYLQTGVDNVSVMAETVPEPASLMLLGTGIAVVARRIRASRRKSEPLAPVA